MCGLGVRIGALSVLAIVLAGCGGQSRSTRLVSDDLLEASSSMAEQLAASDWLAGRSASDDVVIVAIDRVENLSSDVIPSGEQWLMVDRLRAGLPMQQLSVDRAVKFVIPAERLKELRGSSAEFADVGLERSPTHRMGGVIRSVTRVGGGGRTDLYVFDCVIEDLMQGATVWTGSFEVKRLAFGRGWD